MSGMLLEGNSSVLFHFTDGIGFMGMLSSGGVNLSVLNASVIERGKTNAAFSGTGEKLFYLSLARNRNNLYVHENVGGAVNAILEFEGRVLSRYGRVIPFKFSNLARGEMEDRLVSDEAVIPLSAVKCIHILIRRNAISGGVYRYLEHASREYNVKFYEQRGDWISGRNEVELGGDHEPDKPSNVSGAKEYVSIYRAIPVLLKYARGEELTAEDREKSSLINGLNIKMLMSLAPHDRRIIELGKLIRKKYHSGNEENYMLKFMNEIKKGLK